MKCYSVLARSQIMASPDDDYPLTVLQRAPVLAACRDQQCSRQQLVDRTGSSRSTVYRVTVSLEERGLLENTRNGYRTTPYGAAVLAAANSYRTAVETVSRLEPLLEAVDDPELTEHAHLLADGDITLADASNPYRVVERVVERFEETVTSRGTIASTTHLEAIEQVAPNLAQRESIERIFTKSALEAHSTVAEGAFAKVTSADTVSLYVTDDDRIPFSFAIDNDSVTVVGHGGATGLPSVHVESDSPEARVWLETVYERCQSAAEPL